MSYSRTDRIMPALLLLFVGSGCSALIYEIVWFQLLQLAIGSSAMSLGVLLGTFMGGMCLGSLLLPRAVSPARHPLRVYAVLELAIGVLGITLLYVMPAVGRFYVTSSGHSVWVRAVICAMGLLPPTILMGATLPAIARWMETTPRGMSRLGMFYGANIAGAVFGCLAAGFYLLRVYDLHVATWSAVAINLLVAVIGWSLAHVAPHSRGEPTSEESRPHSNRAVLIAIGLSGAAALGAEVTWTRLLSLLLGATVYTFSIILAVFLTGLGIGSSIGSALAASRFRPRVALGICQLLLTGAIAWSAYALTQSLPYWPIDVSLTNSPWIQFQLDLMRCAWAVLPPACLWGASFPLALAAAAARGQDPGKLAGSVYAANTLGAIAGALLFSVVAIQAVGTQRAQQILIGLSALSAILMLAPVLLGSSPSVNSEDSQSLEGSDDSGYSEGEHDMDGQPEWVVASLAMLGVLAITGAAAWTVAPPPPGLIGYGRYLATYSELPEFIHVAEGMNASIAVSEMPNNVRNFHVSGKVVASSEPQDMRLQRMLCHLPALIHDGPKTVLIVGCGAGVTSGTFVVHPLIERIVICEIEPQIPVAAGKYFAIENHRVMDDPRVTVIHDDARHYIATTSDRFDIITSDPIHPWVKGAAALYSREYYALCQKRLNPGGIVTQWVPLYESNEAAVKSQIGTFMDSYANGTIWANTSAGEGYDIVLMGSLDPMVIDVDQLQQRLEQPDHRPVLSSLREDNMLSATDLLATYAGQASDLKPWLADAEINHDGNLRLQYLAGLSVNLYESDAIYRSFLAYRHYPKNLFAASTAEETRLRQFFPVPETP